MAFLVTNYRWGGSIYRRWVGSFLCGGGSFDENPGSEPQCISAESED